MWVWGAYKLTVRVEASATISSPEILFLINIIPQSLLSVHSSVFSSGTWHWGPHTFLHVLKHPP